MFGYNVWLQCFPTYATLRNHTNCTSSGWVRRLGLHLAHKGHSSLLRLQNQALHAVDAQLLHTTIESVLMNECFTTVACIQHCVLHVPTLLPCYSIERDHEFDKAKYHRILVEISRADHIRNRIELHITGVMHRALK